MSDKTEISYKVTTEQMTSVMRKVAEELLSNKFHMSLLSAKSAAELHCCSAKTITKYANLGILKPVQTNPLKFKGSDVLNWDMTKIMYSKDHRHV